MSWSKSLVYWREGLDVYISVVFTWHIPEAIKLCSWNKSAGCIVHVGGPAVDLMPHLFTGYADYIGGLYDHLPLSRLNPDATFTTRGCIRKCQFCAVPLIEGDFFELSEWTPAPMVCDNNLLASSRKHFDNVIDRLMPFKGVDFNQGLDARLLKCHHIDRLQDLQIPIIRLAFDHVRYESAVMDAIEKLFSAGVAKRRLRCYVLFGFDDTPQDALYRAELIKSKGLRPFLQRYQSLNSLTKDSYIGEAWSIEEMARFQRYWCRQNWFNKIPYSEFKG